jgi:MFS transporter, AAHS family, 4-hydroxybenzoate transporter
VTLLAFLVVLFDGYDLTVLGYAAPSLIKSWGITNVAAFAPAFSASLFGVLLGSPIYGYVGDKFGRKIAIMLSALNVGILTLAAVWATSLDQLVVLRFLAGIGIGGMLPNLFALNAEFAAKRNRTTAIILVNCGVAGGAGIPGLVSAALVPSHGWEILFYVGGIIPIVMAGVTWLWLPESIRFLALKAGRQAELRRLLTHLAPGLAIAPHAKFVLGDEKNYQKLSVRQLFADGLWLMTPLLWFLYAVDLMSQYFLNSWMPTLLANAQVSVSRAAIVTVMMQIGGVIGGLAIMRPVDRFGMAPITLLFAIGIPSVALIGFLGDYADLLTGVAFFLGASAVGGNLGLNAIAASFYPTSLRSSGVGWALGIGRFGAVLGPLVGGLLISLHLSMQHLFLVATIPFILGTIVSLLLQRMYAARMAGAGEPLRRARLEAALPPAG